MYVRNLNWLLVNLYLQVNAGFIASNIRGLEFLHKDHNDANKKHKVYLGDKQKGRKQDSGILFIEFYLSE